MAAGCDISRRAFDAFNARDIEGLLELLAPDVEFRPLRLPPGTTRVRGREAIREMARRFEREGELHRFSIETCKPAGDDRVLVSGTVSYEGEEMPFAGIHTVRDGKIVAMEHYFSDEASLLQAGRETLRPAER